MKLIRRTVIALLCTSLASPGYVNAEESAWRSFVQGWIYPGAPACDAGKEIADGRVLHVLKAEYYRLNDAGRLVLRTASRDGCNGYSAANAAAVKKFSQHQYVTVSGGTIGMRAMTSNATLRTQAVSALTTFIRAIGFSGVELDFEGFGSWTAADYRNYKQFVRELGEALHADGRRLLVDGPPISNQTEQGYYQWRYEDFNALPVDQIVVMAYDYQYDYGAGSPVAPNAWVVGIIRWVKQRIPDTDRIVIGMPSYGYHGFTGQYRITIDTLEQSKQFPGFTTARRDPISHEMHWQSGDTSYFTQDTISLNRKRELIESEGIKHISVWHLGGNAWFSGKTEPGAAPPSNTCPCPTVFESENVFDSDPALEEDRALPTEMRE